MVVEELQRRQKHLTVAEETQHRQARHTAVESQHSQRQKDNQKRFSEYVSRKFSFFQFS
jgi:hypothetical protein